jgi:hypothetical protein
MFKRNDELKEGLISYLQSKTAITSLLYNDDANEIKESQWQGTVAYYPCVRVRIISNNPVGDCSAGTYSASIMCYSEEASSEEADRIAGIIGNTLHNTGFTSSGIRFTVIVSNLVPAIRQDARTWRSEIFINGIVS